MQVPLEIAFHKIHKPDWAEDEIRTRVAKLEKIYSGLIGCRVRVVQKSHAARTPPVVQIEMMVPGQKDLVVSYEPERLQLRYKNPDLGNAIADAFAAAERQLLELKRQREGGATADYHDAQNQFLGRVAEIYPKENYGYLTDKDGSLLYFHRNSILGGDFDDLKPGDEVHYVEDVGDTGPIATKVRPTREVAGG